MKSQLWSVALAALALMLLSGCSTLKNPTPETIEDVSFGIKTAASVGGQIALEEDPTLRPKFDQAILALNRAIEATNFSPAVLHSILLTFNIKELKSPYARIAVVGSEVAFHRYARKYPLETPALVSAAMMALRDGLQEALAVVPVKPESRSQRSEVRAPALNTAIFVPESPHSPRHHGIPDAHPVGTTPRHRNPLTK